MMKNHEKPLPLGFVLRVFLFAIALTIILATINFVSPSTSAYLLHLKDRAAHEIASFNIIEIPERTICHLIRYVSDGGPGCAKYYANATEVIA
jgi:hypothetical protein